MMQGKDLMADIGTMAHSVVPVIEHKNASFCRQNILFKMISLSINKAFSCGGITHVIFNI